MRFNKSKIVRKLKMLRYPLIVCATLLASICLAVTVYAADVKTVIVNYNGELIELTSDEVTVERALLDAGIVLEGDVNVSCDINALLSTVDSIEITNKSETVLSIPGVAYEFPEISYQPEKFESVNLSDRSDIETVIEADAPVQEIETSYETVQWTEDFETEYRADNSMYEGNSYVAQEGKNGVRTVKYVIKKVDGQIISKDIESSEITEAPVKKVVVYGTKQQTVTAKGKAIAYTKVHSSFKATAYTACDKWGHSTASGMYAQVGVIAVDPSVIPMGTKVYIEGINGAGDYGYAIAGDTGGAIKGNIIDLYKNSDSECNAWGVKYVNIYVLEDQSVDIFSLR